MGTNKLSSLREPIVFIRDPYSGGNYPKSGCDFEIVEFKIVSGTSLSDTVFDISPYVRFAVKVPDLFTAANLELLGAETVTGAFSSIRDNYGTDVEISGIVTGSWYVFPVESFPLPYAKIRSKNSSGVAVNQSATRNLLFCMKG